MGILRIPCRVLYEVHAKNSVERVSSAPGAGKHLKSLRAFPLSLWVLSSKGRWEGQIRWVLSGVTILGGWTAYPSGCRFHQMGITSDTLQRRGPRRCEITKHNQPSNLHD